MDTHRTSATPWGVKIDSGFQVWLQISLWCLCFFSFQMSNLGWPGCLRKLWLFMAETNKEWQPTRKPKYFHSIRFQNPQWSVAVCLTSYLRVKMSWNPYTVRPWAGYTYPASFVATIWFFCLFPSELFLPSLQGHWTCWSNLVSIYNSLCLLSVCVFLVTSPN